jgi:hypothetical protein
MDDGEINTSAGGLVLTNNNAIRVELFQTKHNSVDITALDDYFDYYGYAFNQFMTPNLDDKAYLQVGSEFLSGSEVDVLLNRYLMHGIKIKKSLP